MLFQGNHHYGNHHYGNHHYSNHHYGNHYSVNHEATGWSAFCKIQLSPSGCMALTRSQCRLIWHSLATNFDSWTIQVITSSVQLPTLNFFFLCLSASTHGPLVQDNTVHANYAQNPQINLGFHLEGGGQRGTFAPPLRESLPPPPGTCEHCMKCENNSSDAPQAF